MSNHSVFILWIIGLLVATSLSAHGQIFATTQGQVNFTSDAPLELIQAQTKSLRGLLDTEKLTFAFSVKIRNFQGFNSPLQQEHFNEKFLESTQFPHATFNGKIIERIDFSIPATHSVRAKGILNIHGVEQERIIRGKLVISKDKLTINAEFNVPLTDHHIDIPSIVFQKIAEEIQVNIQAELVSN